MLRIRRYRVFLICAVLVTIGLYKLSTSRDWDSSSIVTIDGLKSLGGKSTQTGNLKVGDAATPAEVELKPLGEGSKAEGPLVLTSTTPIIVPSEPTTPAVKTSGLSAPAKQSPPTIPEQGIPSRRPSKIIQDSEDEVVSGSDGIQVSPPGRQEFISFAPEQTPIHWEPQKEHFPVPSASVIQLPLGQPKTIPKIQHAFVDETSDAKLNREKRQATVKAEFQRAWTAYKNNAWMHDELSPMTGNFRDPFCGWAATLVDTLDTLWIMGLIDDFEEAAAAVDKIDFTTSPRSDIPLFETTIRYLGGLLAAYDISGGKYRNLLDKAVELADILMGAFDTPNRMPITFYYWKPTLASQPHRARPRTNTAELGSLSLEFTRLAQLTKEPRYYDAVARITNALEEWQNRGTRLDGVFPDDIDASGCNQTARRTSQAVKDGVLNGPGLAKSPVEVPVGYEPPMSKNHDGTNQQFGSKSKADLEIQITPGQPGKAHITKLDETSDIKDEHNYAGANDYPAIPGVGADLLKAATVSRRELPGIVTNSSASTAVREVANAIVGTIQQGLDESTVRKIGNADGTFGDWDCPAQGLTSSSIDQDHFSMGGGQDSTYEYFSKVTLRHLFILVPLLTLIAIHSPWRPGGEISNDVPEDNERRKTAYAV